MDEYIFRKEKKQGYKKIYIYNQVNFFVFEFLLLIEKEHFFFDLKQSKVEIELMRRLEVGKYSTTTIFLSRKKNRY